MSAFRVRVLGLQPSHFLTLTLTLHPGSQDHPSVMSSKKRSSESGAEPDNSVRSKKAKVNTTAKAKIDSNGDRYWEISKMRRVTISSFRGKTQVNVREYYEKDGQELPGKKVS